MKKGPKVGMVNYHFQERTEVKMKRLLLALTILTLIVIPSFADAWYHIDVHDVFDDSENTGYYTLTDPDVGTYKGRVTSGTFTYVLGVVEQTGDIHVRIMEDGVEKDLTTTKGGAEETIKGTSYKINFRTPGGEKYSYDGGLLQVSSTYYDNRISFYHDFREYLVKNPILEVVITSDYGQYNLGAIDFSELIPVLQTSTTYQIGDTGPAGGIIFYDCDADNSSGNPDNLTSATCGWQYLEAAAEDIGLYPFGYYRPNGTNIAVGTSTAIGTGAANTAALVQAMGSETYIKSRGTAIGAYAAQACADYTVTYDGVIYDDWFLPSKDELALLYTNLAEEDLGNFEKSAYWSSSEYNGGNSWLQYFYSGYQYCYIGANKHYVRPIRFL